MKRLDSAFLTASNKWIFSILIAFFWCLTISGITSGDPGKRERMHHFLCVLPPISILALWWFFSFKKVFLDGNTLIIHGIGREARIPASNIAEIYKRHGGKGPNFITIKFKSATDFGRKVRFIPSGDDLERVAGILRDAMEGKDNSARVKRVSNKPSNSPNQNHRQIMVSGWSDNELSNILSEFTDMYRGELGGNFDCELSSHDKGATRVTFPHDIPAEQFSFLINYLNYPKNYDLKGRSISVTGEAILSPDFHLPNNSLVGKKAIFYVPANDKDYDVVYVHVGNETFQNSFAGSRWKKVEDARIPADIDSSCS